MKIYVLKDGLRYGPYSVEELRGQLEAGFFNPEHFASVDEGRSWIPIGQVSALALPRFAVQSDTQRNLLLITYRGRVTRKDVDECAAEIRRAVAGLDGDFELLVDFTEMKSMDITCAAGIAEIMDLCNKAGVTAVVRVIPDGSRDIGLQILSLFHYADDVFVQTCPTMEAAWRILAPDNREEKAEATEVTA